MVIILNFRTFGNGKSYTHEDIYYLISDNRNRMP